MISSSANGRRRVEYELPELKEILEETLGVIVYQNR
jgi:DNA polymerase III alpha subunit